MGFLIGWVIGLFIFWGFLVLKERFEKSVKNEIRQAYLNKGLKDPYCPTHYTQSSVLNSYSEYDTLVARNTHEQTKFLLNNSISFVKPNFKKEQNESERL